MIFDAQAYLENEGWRREFYRLMDVLLVVDKDLERIAALLRGTPQDATKSGVEVWTESPSDDERVAANHEVYSLEGWRSHFKRQFKLASQWNRSHGAKLAAIDPAAKAGLDQFLATLPQIGSAFAAVVSRYRDAQSRVLQDKLSQADREALADAIEAAL